MSTKNEQHLQSLANELAKTIKTEKDLSGLSCQLLKMTVGAALGAEIEEHLGYAIHEAKGRKTGNSRNGYSHKTLKGPPGEVVIHTPRNRNGDFEPQLIRKGQTQLTQFDDQTVVLEFTRFRGQLMFWACLPPVHTAVHTSLVNDT